MPWLPLNVVIWPRLSFQFHMLFINLHRIGIEKLVVTDGPDLTETVGHLGKWDDSLPIEFRIIPWLGLVKGGRMDDRDVLCHATHS